MKVSTLLVASLLLVAMPLLVAPSDINLIEILKGVIKKLEHLPITKVYLVEEVKTLVPTCGDTFFCKVYDIMLHKNFSTLVEEKKLEMGEKLQNKTLLMYLKEEEKLMANLKVHNEKNNCTLLLSNVKPSNVTVQLNVFFHDIGKCIRSSNLREQA